MKDFTLKKELIHYMMLSGDGHHYFLALELKEDMSIQELEDSLNLEVIWVFEESPVYASPNVTLIRSKTEDSE